MNHQNLTVYLKIWLVPKLFGYPWLGCCSVGIFCWVIQVNWPSFNRDRSNFPDRPKQMNPWLTSCHHLKLYWNSGPPLPDVNTVAPSWPSNCRSNGAVETRSLVLEILAWFGLCWFLTWIGTRRSRCSGCRPPLVHPVTETRSWKRMVERKQQT